MEKTLNYVGIDVSKLTLDVSVEIGTSFEHKQYSNTQSGYEELCSYLEKKGGFYHCVMEASGTYYLGLATYLYEKKLGVSVVNPLVIKRFCQMRMTRAKTDKKDSMRIAEYGKAEKPSFWEPEASYLKEIRQIMTHIDLLQKTIVQYLNQKEALLQIPDPSIDVLNSLEELSEKTQEKVRELEAKMRALIEENHAQMFENLQTIPGIGPKTATMLIVVSGAFTRFSSAKQLISYLGLAPRIFQSGTSVRGKSRICKMGMGRVRATLYMCSRSAKRCNKTCQDLFNRLRENGKAFREANIAVVNKLIKQAFAIATKNQVFDPNFLQNT